MKLSPCFHHFVLFVSFVEPLYIYLDIVSAQKQNTEHQKQHPIPKHNHKQETHHLYPQNRFIIGGTEVEKERYPYQVALLNPRGIPICGGTLIHPEWVLSAAHCSDFVNSVEIGRHRFSKDDDDETYESTHPVSIFVHPNFNFLTWDNDVMLIYLATRSNFTPVQLYNGSSSTLNLTMGLDVTVMGWGHINTTTQERSDVLLEAELDMVTNEECQWAHASVSDVVVTDNMICAGRSGFDSCQGDSGGPLIVKGENFTSDIQLGITSWGFGCDLGIPGGYSFVASASIQEFIQSTTSCRSDADADADADFSDCCAAKCVNGEMICIRRKFSLADPNSNLLDFFMKCEPINECWVGDGKCDLRNNYVACDYDGGDCCQESCIDGDFDCGLNGYACFNPAYLDPLGSLFTFFWNILISIVNFLF